MKAEDARRYKRFVVTKQGGHGLEIGTVVTLDIDQEHNLNYGSEGAFFLDTRPPRFFWFHQLEPTPFEIFADGATMFEGKRTGFIYTLAKDTCTDWCQFRSDERADIVVLNLRDLNRIPPAPPAPEPKAEPKGKKLHSHTRSRLIEKKRFLEDMLVDSRPTADGSVNVPRRFRDRVIAVLGAKSGLGPIRYGGAAELRSGSVAELARINERLGLSAESEEKESEPALLGISRTLSDPFGSTVERALWAPHLNVLDEVLDKSEKDGCGNAFVRENYAYLNSFGPGDLSVAWDGRDPSRRRKEAMTAERDRLREKLGVVVIKWNTEGEGAPARTPRFVRTRD